MPVELITDGLIIRPNHVFIIPPQRDLHVLRGEFRLKPISKPRGWPDVITVFLRSLAKHWSGKLIAVIVSGFDGDGADALCAIRGVGGVTIAQKLETAQKPDMPAARSPAGASISIYLPRASRWKSRGSHRRNRRWAQCLPIRLVFRAKQKWYSVPLRGNEGVRALSPSKRSDRERLQCSLILAEATFAHRAEASLGLVPACIDETGIS
jgi:hypothetical protein